MWKPANQPATPPQPEKSMRPSSAERATIGKSLVIKGEVSGSESLYIDGQVEGSINLAGNGVTVGRNGVVAANINAREIVVLGKVHGNLVASDRVDIRNEGSLTGDVIAQWHRHPQARPEDQRRRQGSPCIGRKSGDTADLNVSSTFFGGSL